MPIHLQRGFALIGFGLLIGIVGLVWVANLFGLVDEFAKRWANSRWNRWWAGTDLTAVEVRTNVGFQLGRHITGGGFILIGLLAVASGVTYMIA
ncbi:MAG TPA: hypothetical protein VK028_15115 [Micromonosporaceae bacterium]|nr:hypothetical protein [Micromonosporaceae bacterium]